jgi:hypothetical protein
MGAALAGLPSSWTVVQGFGQNLHRRWAAGHGIAP